MTTKPLAPPTPDELAALRREHTPKPRPKWCAVCGTKLIEVIPLRPALYGCARAQSEWHAAIEAKGITWGEYAKHFDVSLTILPGLATDPRVIRLIDAYAAALARIAELTGSGDEP